MHLYGSVHVHVLGGGGMQEEAVQGNQEQVSRSDSNKRRSAASGLRRLFLCRVTFVKPCLQAEVHETVFIRMKPEEVLLHVCGSRRVPDDLDGPKRSTRSEMCLDCKI